MAEQGVHDRLRRSWRHLDFFQYEAWLHADVPRVACSGCGKTAQVAVPWAREGSGFTALFEALALSLCAQMPVRQAAELLTLPGGAAPAAPTVPASTSSAPAPSQAPATPVN